MELVLPSGMAILSAHPGPYVNPIEQRPPPLGILWPRIVPMSTKHPHFDDRGTLEWHTSFQTAQAAAKRDKKRLFIELGREL